ncbi:MAG: PIG-L family deacetylase [Acidobacteria bacterium]|nr:MAG: PIG-L family deacetylase [Acidobacteriota bacterium]
MRGQRQTTHVRDTSPRSHYRHRFLRKIPNAMARHRPLTRMATSLSLLILLMGSPIGSARVESPMDETIIGILQRSQRVLWIGAHPDDENSSGGLIARAKDVSGTLFMVSVTRGENSDIVWGGLCRGSQIGRARAALFAQSAALFRADGYELGPFVNGPHTIDELDRQCPPGAPFRGWPPTTTSDQVIAKWRREGDPVKYIVTVLRRYRPQVVLAMDNYCGVSGNPEHIAVARLLLEAIPLAADAGSYPGTGDPWQVEYVIFSAHVIPPLVQCHFCKCEGQEPQEPVQEVPSLDRSRTHNMTYFRVSCLVAKTYQNTMQQRGWSESQIQAICAQAERDALRAYQQGVRTYPLIEPYRLHPMK